MATHQDLLRRIRDAVLDGRYVVTPHALTEMRDDHLVLSDIESALLEGTIEEEYRNDPRGTRYCVIGRGVDLSTPVAVVLRFIHDDHLLIITTYVPSQDNE